MLADPTRLLLKAPVIPVLTIERSADGVALARALAQGGLPVIEVTLRTKAALEAARAIAAELPEVVLGIGTVTSPADIEPALKAGAQFLVSPPARRRRSPTRSPLRRRRRSPAAPPSRRRSRSPNAGSGC